MERSTRTFSDHRGVTRSPVRNCCRRRMAAWYVGVFAYDKQLLRSVESIRSFMGFTPWRMTATTELLSTELCLTW